MDMYRYLPSLDETCIGSALAVPDGSSVRRSDHLHDRYDVVVSDLWETVVAMTVRPDKNLFLIAKK